MISVRRRRATRLTGERDHGQRSEGVRAAGAIAHVWRLVRKRLFKTAGFRVREAEARGSCRRVDADRDERVSD
jgi:hypothetical protein